MASYCKWQSAGGAARWVLFLAYGYVKEGVEVGRVGGIPQVQAGPCDPLPAATAATETGGLQGNQVLTFRLQQFWSRVRYC